MSICVHEVVVKDYVDARYIVVDLKVTQEKVFVVCTKTSAQETERKMITVLKHLREVIRTYFWEAKG